MENIQQYKENEPLTVEDLKWEFFSAEFKQEYVDTWNKAYDAEKTVGGNIGINILCVLEHLNFLIQLNIMPTTVTFDEAYKIAANELLSKN